MDLNISLIIVLFWISLGQGLYCMALTRRVYELRPDTKSKNMPPKGAFLKGASAILLGPLVYFLIE